MTIYYGSREIKELYFGSQKIESLSIGNINIPVVSTVTFTVIPNPADATVVLTATGYTQSGNSISVAPGTTITYTVSKEGYETQTGTQVCTFNSSINCALEVMGAQGTFCCYYFEDRYDGSLCQSRYTIYDTDGTTVLYTLESTTNETWLPGTLSPGQYIGVSGHGTFIGFYFYTSGFTGLTVEEISDTKVKVLTVSDGFSIDVMRA